MLDNTASYMAARTALHRQQTSRSTWTAANLRHDYPFKRHASLVSSLPSVVGLAANAAPSDSPEPRQLCFPRPTLNRGAIPLFIASSLAQAILDHQGDVHTGERAPQRSTEASGCPVSRAVDDIDGQLIPLSKMMKIDVNKSGRIFDFLVSAGMLILSYDPTAKALTQVTPRKDGLLGVELGYGMELVNGTMNGLKGVLDIHPSNGDL